jgi:predicted RNase H-like HicB family nuclease
MKMKTFLVVYEKGSKNFSGYAPDITGCIATAKTLPPMRAALRGALEAHLQWLADDGDPIPTASETVTADMEPDPEFPQPPGYYVVVEKLSISMPKSKTSKRRITGLKRVAAKRRALQAA